MKASPLLLVIIISAVAIRVDAQAPQGTSAPDTPSVTPESTEYSRLVDRLKAGDRSVNFTEFRMAFTETAAYTGTMMGVYRPLWNALNMKDFEGALEVADAVFQRNYAEPNAHMVASIAHRELGRPDEAQFHRFIADGLLKSIISQGDGKTPETAYQVIDISEEYALFRAMNLTPRGQSAAPPAEGQPAMDRMTVVDNRTKEQRVMYFSVENRQSLQRKRAAPPQ